LEIGAWIEKHFHWSVLKAEPSESRKVKLWEMGCWIIEHRNKLEYCDFECSEILL
jgi:hypothetical protein